MAATATPAKVKMAFDAPTKAILHQLVYRGMQTEHELVQQVVSKTSIEESQAISEIGAWLSLLRRSGFVWAGVVTNHDNKGMWVAVATAEGKKYTKENEI